MRVTEAEAAKRVDERMRLMDTLLVRLREFQSDRFDEERAGKADEALDILRSHFSRRGSEWMPDDTAVLYYGSMLYHDPNELDMDVVLLGAYSIPKVVEIKTKLENVTDWPTPPKELWGRADVWQVSSEEIKRQAPIYGTQEDLYGPIAFKAALVLSSEPLFPTNFHQVSLLNQARSDVIQLAREYPNFRDGIIYNLVEVVKRRQIRRGLRKN